MRGYLIYMNKGIVSPLPNFKTVEYSQDGEKSTGFFKCAFIKDKVGNIKEIPLSSLNKELKDELIKLLK